MLKVHTHTVTIHKFSPKFWGPYRVQQPLSGHKYKIWHIDTGENREEHEDHLNVCSDVVVATKVDKDDGIDAPSPISSPASVVNNENDVIKTQQIPERKHEYHLRLWSVVIRTSDF